MIMINKENLKENILYLLGNSGEPVRLNQFSKSLQIPSQSPEYELLKEVLNELVQSGFVNKSSRRRYSLPGRDDLSHLTGILRMDNNRGIVKTNDPEYPVVVVRSENFNTAFAGDIVKIQLLAGKQGKKPRGEVVEILERDEGLISGTIQFDGLFYFLIPDEEKFYVDFMVPDKLLNGAKEHDKVIGKLVRWDNPSKSPAAEVIEVLGDAGKPDVEYESIIKEFDLPEYFPDNVEKEALGLEAPNYDDLDGRLDLRDELIITIDPYDARDFDDALSLKILPNGNYQLGVHIADVSHYVKENSALDIEARARGNSTYLVDRVVPMLPEKLSNNVCSLRPKEPRYAFTVFIEIGKRMAIRGYSLHESLIYSKKRYNYEEVLDVIEGANDENKELLHQLHHLTTKLREKRFKKGGIQFDTSEVKFVLDENKYPIDVKLKQTTKSTYLVEECMLLANQVVATYVKDISKEYRFTKLLPFVYRVHDTPDQTKIKEAFDFISTLGNKVKLRNPDSKDINNLIKSYDGTPEKEIVNQVLIRSMSKAEYSQVNYGHYGLGFQEYSHFTSPIRRYPDLLIHRLLKEYMKGNVKPDRAEYLKILCKDISKYCSETERKSMEAERASIKLTHTVMAQEYLGSVFQGTVSGVMNFGIFVTLDQFHGEGLVHIRDMNDDYYIFEESKKRIIGRRKKKAFGFGTRLRVMIKKVNVDKRNIDLEFIDTDVD